MFWTLKNVFSLYLNINRKLIIIPRVIYIILKWQQCCLWHIVDRFMGSNVITSKVLRSPPSLWVTITEYLCDKWPRICSVAVTIWCVLQFIAYHRCIRLDGPAARCSGRPKLPRQFVPVRNFEPRLFVPMPGNMDRPAFTFINLYIFCNLQRIISKNIHLGYVCIYFLIRNSFDYLLASSLRSEMLVNGLIK